MESEVFPKATICVSLFVLVLCMGKKGGNFAPSNTIGTGSVEGCYQGHRLSSQEAKRAELAHSQFAEATGRFATATWSEDGRPAALPQKKVVKKNGPRSLRRPERILLWEQSKNRTDRLVSQFLNTPVMNARARADGALAISVQNARCFSAPNAPEKSTSCCGMELILK